MKIFCDTNIVLEFLQQRTQGCDVLLTINKKHFERFAQNASLSVLTPIEFLNVYVKGEKTR